jgi:Uma2 family endonuclease
MTTTIESSAVPDTPAILRVPILPEGRIVLRGVSWETYERLVEEVGDITTLMAYNRGVLELISPGAMHERLKKRIDRLVGVATEELDIPCVSMSSTRWRSVEAKRAIEADECYMLTAAKVAASEHDSPRAVDYPSPDLAVEIDISPSEVHRAEIYATLRIPEVWRFDGETLLIDRLRDDGTYVSVAESLFLPITPAEVVHWVFHPDSRNESVWSRRFRAWVRAELAPRRGGNA